MSTLQSQTDSIFDIKYLNQAYSKNAYRASNYIHTQDALTQHFQSSEFDDICKIMANEATNPKLKIPAAQTIIDISHQSMQDWSSFIENTTISDIRQDNIDTFTTLKTYQSQFNSSIYAPLHEHLSTTNTKFEGNAEELLLRISQLVKKAKKQRITGDYGIQFDVRYTPKIASERCCDVAIKNQEETKHSNIDDEETDDGKTSASIKAAPSAKQVVSDVLKHAKIKTSNLRKRWSFEGIIQFILNKECREASTMYPRYEILMDDTKVIKTFPAIQNNTIPSIDIGNIPLCRIYNSTQSVQSILDYLAATEHKDISHMMTFSIHRYHTNLEIYFYIYANGKLYGSRMFEDDLMTIIPKLFEDETVKDTKSIHENFKIHEDSLNIQFNRPQKYEECKMVLFRQNQESTQKPNIKHTKHKPFVYNKNNLSQVTRPELLQDQQQITKPKPINQELRVIKYKNPGFKLKDIDYMALKLDVMDLLNPTRQDPLFLTLGQKLSIENQQINNKPKTWICDICHKDNSYDLSQCVDCGVDAEWTVTGRTQQKSSLDIELSKAKKQIREQEWENQELSKSVQKKNETVQQKESVIIQQQSEIQDLKQQIKELQIFLNDSESFKAESDLNDITSVVKLKAEVSALTLNMSELCADKERIIREQHNVIMNLNLDIQTDREKLSRAKKENQRKNTMIQQKDSIIIEQQSEIEDLKQKISINHPSSSSSALSLAPIPSKSATDIIDLRPPKQGMSSLKLYIPSLCADKDKPNNLRQKYQSDQAELSKAKEELRKQRQENQRKIEIIKQKDHIITEQKSEIEDLRQKIVELEINMNRSPSPPLHTAPFISSVSSRFSDLADMTLDALNRFCDSDNDSHDDLDLDQAIVANEIDPGLLSDCSLDSGVIDSILNKICTQCPAGNGSQNSNRGHGNYNNNFNNNGNNRNHPNVNRKKGNNRQNRNNGNNNDNDDNKDGDDGPNGEYKSNHDRHKPSCNHLKQCNQCRAVFESIQAMMQNKEKVDKKPKSKKQAFTANGISYDADTWRLLGGRIGISKHVTEDIIPNSIKENPSNVYKHVHKKIVLHLMNGTNDDEKYQDQKIIPLGLHDRHTNNVLFCIIQRDETSSHYAYRMVERLFTASDLSPQPIPILSTTKFAIEAEMKLIKSYVHPKKFKWKNIPIFRKTKEINTIRMTLAVDSDLMNNRITLRFLQENMSLSPLTLIPILLFENNSYRIEYIFTMYFPPYGSIGISMRADTANGVQIGGVHLVWDKIRIQHESVMPGNHINDCHHFDKLNSIIDDILIGNPDEWQNKAQDYEGRYTKARDTLHGINHRINGHLGNSDSKKGGHRKPPSSPSTPSYSTMNSDVMTNSLSQSLTSVANNGFPSVPMSLSSQSCLSTEINVSVKHIEDCNEKQMIDLVEKICSLSDKFTLHHKQALINWFKETNIMGSSLMKFNSKTFGNEIVSYFDNKKLRGPAVHLFNQIMKYGEW